MEYHAAKIYSWTLLIINAWNAKDYYYMDMHSLAVILRVLYSYI